MASRASSRRIMNRIRSRDSIPPAPRQREAIEPAAMLADSRPAAKPSPDRAMSGLERFGTPGVRHSTPGIWTEHKDAGDVPWTMRLPTMHRAHPRGS